MLPGISFRRLTFVEEDALMKSEKDYRIGRRRWLPRLLSVLVVGLCAAPVLASDGVLEINQVKVIKAGGFPYVIGRVGSYRLTSNLYVTIAADPKNTNAIQVDAQDVTIDLNGFSILGPAVCSGNPVTSCINTGTGVGVNSLESVGVRNGTIRGMGSAGIALRGGSVERIHAEGNGSDGIYGAEVVRNCVSEVNGQTGFFIPGGLITGSRATGNKADGIFVATEATVSGNSSSFNGRNGITVSTTGVVSNNTATGNTSWGLSLAVNTVGYVGNVLYNNNGGIANPQVVGGVNLGQNLCNAALCP